MRKLTLNLTNWANPVTIKVRLYATQKQMQVAMKRTRGYAHKDYVACCVIEQTATVPKEGPVKRRFQYNLYFCVDLLDIGTLAHEVTHALTDLFSAKHKAMNSEEFCCLMEMFVVEINHWYVSSLPISTYELEWLNDPATLYVRGQIK